MLVSLNKYAHVCVHPMLCVEVVWRSDAKL